MTLLDTAEIYGNGNAEQMIGRVIAGQRDKVFVVSKVWPSHATADGIRAACTASLARLATHYLDLYLLHWRTGVRDLGVVVQTFESLRAEGHIRRWGVSNFEVADMEDLFRFAAARPVPPIRSFTILRIAAASAACSPGAKVMGCRSWPILRSAEAVTCCETPA